MTQLLRAAETFVDRLTAIGWSAVGLAILFHLAKIAARTRSWRNIVAASYPDAIVQWRGVFGAYVAGVGVNALVPARGGDLLKLYLVKHRVRGSTYPTLGATLLVETLFDMLVASLLIVWALSSGVLPGRRILPRLPSIDWLWLFQHPRAGAVVVTGVLVLAAIAAAWAGRRVADFWQRVARGFVILRDPVRYLRRVVVWQAFDWCFRLAAVYFFLLAFGIPAELHNALAVQVTQNLSTVVPLTPAGIGTEQALAVYVLAGEASRAALLSFSVGMKLGVVLVNIVLGFSAITLMLRTLRWRRVTREPLPDNPPARSTIAADENFKRARRDPGA